MQIKEILLFLEQLAPPAYQESYDNARLITGNAANNCTGVLVCLDSIEAVIDEAIREKCNLVVAHHPIVFSGLKSLTGKNYIERTLIKAIKHDIAIYAIHTNLDNVWNGVNHKMAQRLGLTNCKVLAPKAGLLSKLIVYGIDTDISNIRKAIFDTGAGQIANYQECSYTSNGFGTFKPIGAAKPTIGSINQQETVGEQKLEVLVPNHLLPAALNAAKQASSYEAMAYDIIPLGNYHQEVGSGLVGNLPIEMPLHAFFDLVKKQFNCSVIRHTTAVKSTIKRIALCGGSGSFLLNDAIKASADVFFTADYKYHQFFDADNQIVIADIGHYESEQFTIDLLAEQLKQKFSTFAVRLTSINTNPVNYY